MIYRQNIENFLLENAFPKYRANQVMEAVYKQGLLDFKSIGNIPKELINLLNKDFKILCLTPVNISKSKDGKTEKILFELEDKQKVEAVLMKFKDGRNSVCISTQVGCTMGCTFCATGKMGFKRNLTVEEMIDQVLYFFSVLQKEKRTISNIVFMGMGEPFLNYNNVIESIHILISDQYFNFSSRRITVSTCGVINGIDKFVNEPFQANLALSLHAPTQELREKIMPSAKLFPLDKILQSINTYISKTHRRVSFEYILLKEINDTSECAYKLAEIAKNKLIHINLIPYNNIETDGLSGSNKKRIDNFKMILQNNNVNVTVRVTMGEDIAAACGQLANKS